MYPWFSSVSAGCWPIASPMCHNKRLHYDILIHQQLMSETDIELKQGQGSTSLVYKLFS